MEEYNKYTKATARNAVGHGLYRHKLRLVMVMFTADKLIDEAQVKWKKSYRVLVILKEFKFDPGRLDKAWHKIVMNIYPKFC